MCFCISSTEFRLNYSLDPILENKLLSSWIRWNDDKIKVPGDVDDTSSPPVERSHLGPVPPKSSPSVQLSRLCLCFKAQTFTETLRRGVGCKRQHVQLAYYLLCVSSVLSEFRLTWRLLPALYWILDSLHSNNSNWAQYLNKLVYPRLNSLFSCDVDNDNIQLSKKNYVS